MRDVGAALLPATAVRCISGFRAASEAGYDAGSVRTMYGIAEAIAIGGAVWLFLMARRASPLARDTPKT